MNKLWTILACNINESNLNTSKYSRKINPEKYNIPTSIKLNISLLINASTVDHQCLQIEALTQICRKCAKEELSSKDPLNTYNYYINTFPEDKHLDIPSILTNIKQFKTKWKRDTTYKIFQQGDPLEQIAAYLINIVDTCYV